MKNEVKLFFLLAIVILNLENSKKKICARSNKQFFLRMDVCLGLWGGEKISEAWETHGNGEAIFCFSMRKILNLPLKLVLFLRVACLGRGTKLGDS